MLKTLVNDELKIHIHNFVVNRYRTPPESCIGTCERSRLRRLMLTDSLTRSYHKIRYCSKYQYILGERNEPQNVLFIISIELRCSVEIIPHGVGYPSGRSAKFVWTQMVIVRNVTHVLHYASPLLSDLTFTSHASRTSPI